MTHCRLHSLGSSFSFISKSSERLVISAVLTLTQPQKISAKVKSRKDVNWLIFSQVSLYELKVSGWSNIYITPLVQLSHNIITSTELSKSFWTSHAPRWSSWQRRQAVVIQDQVPSKWWSRDRTSLSPGHENCKESSLKSHQILSDLVPKCLLYHFTELQFYTCTRFISCGCDSTFI